jgi:signal peptidase I
LAKAKLTKLLKNSYVKTILLGVILLGAVFAFWFGLRIGLRTDYPLLAVASGSMRPTLNIGDLIVVQGFPNYSEINAVPAPEGTIIVFHKPSDTEELIVHRAVDKMDVNGTWFFRTKGDNNGSYDVWSGEGTLNGWISQRLLVGRVVGVLPWIGNVPLFIRTPSGLVLVVLLFLVILFIEYVPVLSKKVKTETKPEPEAESKAES